jgi:hypothetical protein
MRPVRIIAALVFAATVGTLTLLAGPAWAAPVAIHVSPSSVAAGDTVTITVSGAAGPDCSDSVTLISKAFVHTHDFAGLPAVFATAKPGGVFTATTTIPRSKAAGTYTITGRCGGGNLGVSATLVVRAAATSPSLVPLGSHRFGHLRAPQAIVARAGPNDVGFYRPQEGPSFGPWSFDIARDGSVWLLDQVNDRLLVWRPGRPDRPARTVPLPFKAAVDLVLGPDGTVYVTSGQAQEPDYLYALTSTGQVRWKVALPTDQVVGSLLMGADGVVYYHYHDSAEAWTPLTDPHGRPLPVTERRRRTSPHQPLPGGLRLVTTSPSSHERRFTLINQAGQPVRAWRVTSQTELGALIGAPALLGGDLVVTLGVTQQTTTRYLYEYLVVRLAPAGGTRQRFALDARAVWGDNQTELRVGPDGQLYQLRTSPTTGVRIARYSLGPTPPTPPTTTPAPVAPPATAPPATHPPVSQPGVPAPAVTGPPTQPAIPAAAQPATPAAARPASRWILPGLAALGSGALAALGGWLLYRRRHPAGPSRPGRSGMAH